MRVISFIERHQESVIEKILRHCGLWKEAPPHPPPINLPTHDVPAGRITDYEFFQNLAG